MNMPKAMKVTIDYVTMKAMVLYKVKPTATLQKTYSTVHVQNCANLPGFASLNFCSKTRKSCL